MWSEPQRALVDHLDHIVQLQRTLPGWLTGFYLDTNSILLLGELLSNDAPVPTSVGRYRRIPVFDQRTLSVTKHQPHGEYQRIIYTYAPMLAVD